MTTVISILSRLRINRENDGEEIVAAWFRAAIQGRVLGEDSTGGDYPSLMLSEDNHPILLEQ